VRTQVIEWTTGHPAYLVQATDITQRKIQETELRQAAMTDPLTGCFNRRHFMDCVQSEFKRFQRSGHEFCVIILDIDEFKQINDRFGHDRGDQALINTVKVCQDELRGIDILGRVGGEEFGILLLESTLNVGVEVAERIRAAITSCDTGASQNDRLQLSATVGVTCIRPEDLDISEVINRADMLMYQGKKSGKNKVCHA
jgi:diguanylate cyclase (GGDEF)-like protein